MTTDLSKFLENPRKPIFTPPQGAVDAHCHVFGPGAVFPFAPERKYDPVDGPKERLFWLRDHLGFSRNVVVQASCHGSNNDAMVDALLASKGMARGIAVVRPDVSDAALHMMNDAGVRGVRFNFVKRLVDAAPKDVFIELTNRIAKLGWHVVVYFEADDLTDLIPFLKTLPVKIVVDHMGTPKVGEGVEGANFQQFLQLLTECENIWVKVSCPERLSLDGPPYSDVIPLAREIVKRFPDRVLWGTDWPHPNMRTHMPDEGDLVDYIPKIAPTKPLQQALLVDNPMRLYWPEEAME